jgi:hypothetical protein
VYDYIENEASVLKEVSFGSNVAYIPRNLKFKIIVWPLIGLLIAGIISPIYYLVAMSREMRKMKAILSETTHRLQRMLFISTLLEHIVNSVMIAIPLLFLLFVLVFPIPYGTHVAYSMCTTMSFQTLMSAIFQCYFIKPFRKGVQTLIPWKFLKKPSTQQIFVVPLNQTTTRYDNGNQNNR